MKSEIWAYYRGYFKVYTEDYETKQKIASWNGCKHSNTYYNRYGQLIGWDLIFPSKLYNKVAQLLGLPMRAKNHNRVNQGKKLGLLAKDKDFLGLQNKG